MENEVLDITPLKFLCATIKIVLILVQASLQFSKAEFLLFQLCCVWSHLVSSVVQGDDVELLIYAAIWEWAVGMVRFWRPETKMLSKAGSIGWHHSAALSMKIWVQTLISSGLQRWGGWCNPHISIMDEVVACIVLWLSFLYSWKNCFDREGSGQRQNH